jgi:hypothetical protein
MSTNSERQSGNSLTAAAETTKPTFVPITASQTHLNRTPAITAAMPAIKSSSPKVIRHATAKTLVYRCGYITQWARLYDPELGLENLGNKTLFATFDDIQPHQITLKSRVIL